MYWSCMSGRCWTIWSVDSFPWYPLWDFAVKFSSLDPGKKSGKDWSSLYTNLTSPLMCLCSVQMLHWIFSWYVLARSGLIYVVCLLQGQGERYFRQGMDTFVTYSADEKLFDFSNDQLAFVSLSWRGCLRPTGGVQGLQFRVVTVCWLLHVLLQVNRKRQISKRITIVSLEQVSWSHWWRLISFVS